VPLLALSTGHKLGLALAVLVFAGFSLIVSMLVPRYRPQFPGRGLPVFLAASFVMFLGMLVAVEIFGKESEEEAKAEGAGTTEAKASTERTTAATETTGTTSAAQTTTEPSVSPRTVEVTEVEYKIRLPESSLAAGTYTFKVRNDGKVPHDLVVEGEGVDEKTPTLDGGKSGSLTVELKPGTYDVYCSIPGHKQLGMDTKLTVS
jgi:uncharacterized cupredoxin-like copper-binding protein